MNLFTKSRTPSLKNQAYKALTKSENDWEITMYRAIHKPTGLSYWIANGLLFFNNGSHKEDVSLGFCNWLKLWAWIKNAQRKKVIQSTTPTSASCAGE